MLSISAMGLEAPASFGEALAKLMFEQALPDEPPSLSIEDIKSTVTEAINNQFAQAHHTTLKTATLFLQNEWCSAVSIVTKNERRVQPEDLAPGQILNELLTSMKGHAKDVASAVSSLATSRSQMEHEQTGFYRHISPVCSLSSILITFRIVIYQMNAVEKGESSEYLRNQVRVALKSAVDNLNEWFTEYNERRPGLVSVINHNPNASVMKPAWKITITDKASPADPIAPPLKLENNKFAYSWGHFLQMMKHHNIPELEMMANAWKANEARGLTAADDLRSALQYETCWEYNPIHRKPRVWIVDDVPYNETGKETPRLAFPHRDIVNPREVRDLAEKHLLPHYQRQVLYDAKRTERKWSQMLRVWYNLLSETKDAALLQGISLGQNDGAVTLTIAKEPVAVSLPTVSAGKLDLTTLPPVPAAVLRQLQELTPADVDAKEVLKSHGMKYGGEEEPSVESEKETVSATTMEVAPETDMV